MVYFTSDLHLGHRNAISLCDRPFENIEEMDKYLIDAYNARVSKNDTCYILGDICFRVPVEQANEYISKLNGNKILIVGNHDKKYDESLFEYIRDFETVNINGIYIALMHYPMLEWPRSFQGSLHLHGHIHSKPEYNLKNREQGILRYDVGVDANNYMPVSINEVMNFFNLGTKG